MKMRLKTIRDFLGEKAEFYNSREFIEADPIALPHAFEEKRDIEIIGLFAAIMSWGQRQSILKKGWELIKRMDYQPAEFVTHHQEHDLRVFNDFAHRTLQPTDIQGLIKFLKGHYAQSDSIETLFLPSDLTVNEPVEQGLIGFHQAFTQNSLLADRTLKHIATPAKKAACKRLNMFLRWMVRWDEKGVDFGIWQRLDPADLYCPLDVHVARVAKKLGLIERKQPDWHATRALTAALRNFDANDPVKYDFALFGLGIEGFGYQ